MTQPDAPTRAPSSRSLEARSARLAWLSRALYDPELSAGQPFETGGDRALERLERERAAAALGRLASEYRRIFGHTPGGPCPLYELSWLRAGDFAAEQELSDIGAFYRAFAVQLSASARERIDHAALELEFLAYAAHLEARAAAEADAERVAVAREAQRSFLRDHFGRWAPPFFERMEERAPEGFYRSAARWARAELPRIFADLDVEPAVHVGEPAARAVRESEEPEEVPTP
ncbi:MAG: molecular chaperone TorD family protein [Thermoanaerobaculia bacterium]